MTVLEKIVDDYGTFQGELRRQLIAPDKDSGTRELVAEVDPRTGALSFWSEGELIQDIKMTEIGAVKTLIGNLTKTAS